MDVNKDDGGPAFPVVTATIRHYNGMSLRDWFAGQALAGWLAGETTPDDHSAARYAYAVADAMIAAREAS